MAYSLRGGNGNASDVPEVGVAEATAGAQRRGGWSQGLKEGNALTENNFWFAHPVYFLNHLDRAGLSDASFNPYANKVIARQVSDKERTLRGRSVVVKDNPGFAPEWVDRGFPYEGDVFKANGQAYAVPTGIFNQEYHSVTRGIYRHEGIDFRGRGRTWKEKKEKKDENIDFIGEKILSFIHGKVINCGWVDRGLGRILVVANEHGKGIYLLAHLSGFAQGITRRSRIEPGDVVAYVGRSGENRNEARWDPHLHLEYFDIECIEEHDNGEEDKNQYVRASGEGDARWLTLPDTVPIQNSLSRFNQFRLQPIIVN